MPPSTPNLSFVIDAKHLSGPNTAAMPVFVDGPSRDPSTVPTDDQAASRPDFRTVTVPSDCLAVMIGRNESLMQSIDPTAHRIVLFSSTVSRAHTLFTRPAGGGRWSISDLGSLNRTKLPKHGMAVGPEPVELRGHEELLVLGEVRIAVHLD